MTFVSCQGLFVMTFYNEKFPPVTRIESAQNRQHFEDDTRHQINIHRATSTSNVIFQILSCLVLSHNLRNIFKTNITHEPFDTNTQNCKSRFQGDMCHCNAWNCIRFVRLPLYPIVSSHCDTTLRTPGQAQRKTFAYTQLNHRLKYRVGQPSIRRLGPSQRTPIIRKRSFNLNVSAKLGNTDIRRMHNSHNI